MYTEIYLRLEPLGVELVAQAARRAGHKVRILDLQVFSHQDYFKALDQWHPDAVCFGINYLANIPEVIDLAKETRQCLPQTFFFVGRHSASFTAREILEHAQGTIDCVVRGEVDQIGSSSLRRWMIEKESACFRGWSHKKGKDRHLKWSTTSIAKVPMMVAQVTP
jgi:magnesium-protoporphyrin IX monomethyl ester (oxidative) cyclase